jgi:nicotinate phosphoribosyltransferase
MTAVSGTWIDDDNAALFTDLYELTMLQAYVEEGLGGEAVFTLYFRKLPGSRNYLLSCGLDSVLDYLETLHFTPACIDYLRSLDRFSDRFLGWLEGFRFTGDVYAMPEGTPVFENEPLVEVAGPIAEAQLAETFVINQVHLETVLASKAARVVTAAAGRPVVDFAARRMHGTDAAIKGARAFYVGGVEATSNVLAGKLYGIPVAGTMAHSFVQAHDREEEAFSAFARVFPETILLVDTYDSLEGVAKVIALARELGEDFRVRGVRLDSGDLASLAFAARRMLDAAGLARVQVFASGGLDEDEIAELLARGAPIDAFGVGTGMGVSRDSPALDIAYKLSAYAGRGRLKLSPGKPILPGRKQVFRIEKDGIATGDVIARAEETLPGRPLLRPVMKGGRRVDGASPALAEIRAHAAGEIARLPARIRALAPAEPGYPVEPSDSLRTYQRAVAHRVAGARPAREEADGG